MLVAITGSTGFIGRGVVDELLAHGHEVLALVRPSTLPAKTLQEGVRHYRWNPDQEDWDANPLQAADAIIHLAGENIVRHRWTPAFKARVISSRVQVTERLCRKIAELDKPPGIFLSASAIGYYGDTGSEEVDETGPQGVGFLADLAGRWEAATRPLDAASIRIVSARIGMVVGPDGGALSKMLPAFRLGVGGRLGSGNQYMSWIDREDVARGLVHLLSPSTLSGPVNLTSPHPVTNREWTKTLAGLLHRPAYFPMGKRALRWLFGEIADEVMLTSSRVVPRRLLEEGFSFRYGTLEASLRHSLKVKPEPAVAPKKTFSWFGGQKKQRPI